MSSRAIFIGHCCKCHVTWPSQLALRLMAWPKNLPRIHKESCRESPSPPLGRETRVRFLKLDANCETIIMNFSRSFYFWGPMDGHVIRPPTPSSLPPLPRPTNYFLQLQFSCSSLQQTENDVHFPFLLEILLEDA